MNRLRKSAALLGVAGAVALTSLSPAAANVTPQSLGLPAGATGWQGQSVSSEWCGLGSSCVVQAFAGSNRGAFYTAAGFVNGPNAAANRISDYAGRLRTQALAAGLHHTTRSYSHTYTAKKRQHKVVLSVIEVVAASSGGAIVMTRVVARDQVRKKKGTSGPFAKKVGIGAIDITSTTTLPTSMTANKGKRLSVQMRKLIATGKSHKVAGPVKLGFAQP